MYEYLIYVGVWIGIIFVLGLISLIISKLFPKTKFSKKVNEMIDWIVDNPLF